jgi:2-hydroxychromene-2-carboxylate isomerase
VTLLSEITPNHSRAGRQLAALLFPVLRSALVDYFAVEDGDIYFGVLDGLGLDGEDVVGEHY